MNALYCENSPIIRTDEANSVTDSIRDRTTWQLVAMASTSLLMNMAANKHLPAARFDMLFFVQVMRDVCRKHDDLRAILFQAHGNDS